MATMLRGSAFCVLYTASPSELDNVYNEFQSLFRYHSELLLFFNVCTTLILGHMDDVVPINTTLAALAMCEGNAQDPRPSPVGRMPAVYQTKTKALRN